MKIQITLTKEQYELLTQELFILQLYRENDERIPANECESTILAIIETQHEEVPE